MVTDPDELVSNAQLKAVAMDLLEELPIPALDNPNAVDREAILEVVLRASVGSTSVHQVTENTANSPDRKAVMDRLHRVDQESVDAALNRLLGYIARLCLDSSRSYLVALDFMDNPFHGECFESPAELCSMNACDGTTTCHRYCTAFVIAQNKPLTIAYTKVRSDESRGSPVDRVLSTVDALPIDVETLLMDRAAYTGEVIGRLRETAPPIVPVRCTGTTLRRKLTTTVSTWRQYTICAGTDREQTFPLAVNLTYRNGDRGKHGHAVHGYVAYGQGDRTPAQVARQYGRRATIEKSYQLFRTARATTTTRDPAVRVVFVAVGFILEALWVLLRWAVFAQPRRGGRVLSETFPFASVFLHGIERQLDTELGWRTSYQTNNVGLPASQCRAVG